MKTLSSVQNTAIQEIYSGAIGKLWELVMGEQIHINGFQSSCNLLSASGIKEGMRGVDLCCCSGAGMRFLLTIGNVGHMTGVDFTQAQIDLGTSRMKALPQLAEKWDYVLSPATKTPLSENQFDFVWGEDAWVYVDDKPQLIKEAARIVKPGGIVAFTDWCEGEEMTQEEADRFLNFMQFPTIASIDDYKKMIADAGLELVEATNTQMFAPCVDFYIQMLTIQHTFDALSIVGFDQNMMAALSSEMVFTQNLAHANKVIQARFIARKPL